MFRLQGRWVAALVTEFIDGFGVPNHPSFGGQGNILGTLAMATETTPLNFSPPSSKQSRTLPFPASFHSWWARVGSTLNPIPGSSFITG